MQQPDNSDAHSQREQLLLSLDPHISQLLREACGDTVAMGEYLDTIIQQRLRGWRHGVRVLERAGWSQLDVHLAKERLTNLLNLEFAAAIDLIQGLRIGGLRRLSRQLSRNAGMPAALQAVLLELLAKNRSCARAVALMTPRVIPSWWQRVWR